ncbi:MAG TPA: BON domain-containing protein [Xanthomonadaceae bacterium]|nr:BON domain-containing protein [Xanthomonadaceae bacterium]
MAVSLALGSLALQAEETHPQTETRTLEQQVGDARLEGQIWSAIALNRHLNPFEISIEVQGGTAVLSGEVDEAVDRELAERIAMNAEGVAKVENRITVNPQWQPGEASDDRDFADAVEDATITATVKSRLLWNDNTDGLDINVDTRMGHVTLNGTADSTASKDLATRLAMGTRGVHGVDNRLTVETEAAKDARQARDDRGLDDAITDSWITTKVKSALLYSKNVDGMDLTVETSDGVVTIGGAASSKAERDLAVEIARDIKGVRQVNAAGVRIGELEKDRVAGN